MLAFERQNDKFNFRVAGMAIHDSKILLQSTPELDYWVLPGGRVEFHESTDIGLVREMKEELGIEVQVNRLNYVHELFFKESGKNFHEIGFYYLISLPEGHEILFREGTFDGVEEDVHLLFQWFHFDELNEIEVYPEFIKRDISVMTVSKTIKHEVTVQNKNLIEREPF